MRYNPSRLLVILLMVTLGTSCQDKIDIIYHPPQYNKVAIVPISDTLTISLTDSSYSSISGAHLFSVTGKDYMTFYDKRAEAIRFYDFKNLKLIKTITIKQLFKGRKVKRPQAYAFNFDSILVYTNFASLYLADTSARIYDSVIFLDHGYAVLSTLTNKTPPFFRDKKLYIAAKPYLSTNESSSIKQWRVLQEVDFKKQQTRLFAKLPTVYKDNHFDIFFFEQGYCLNNKGNIVVSFPPDSNVYLVDQDGLRSQINAKSQHQNGPITMRAEELTSSSQRNFLFKDSYDAIYFDPYNERYIRIAQSRISLDNYRSRKWNKSQTAIIMDKDFVIIGESLIDPDINSNNIFLSPDGTIYAQLYSKDKTRLQFIEFNYTSTSLNQTTAQKK